MSLCTAVVVAAGRGERLGAAENKVFLEIAGQPVLLHAVRALDTCPRIGELIIVVGEGEVDRTRAILGNASIGGRVVVGGATRRDSVLAGLREARGTVVLIHDGARPFPSQALIERVLEGTAHHGACVPVLPSIDTLRRVDEKGFLAGPPLDRSCIARMQTPQGFRTREILNAVEAGEGGIPDDATALMTSGGSVFTVPGEETNLKITVPADLEFARAIALSPTTA